MRLASLLGVGRYDVVACDRAAAAENICPARDAEVAIDRLHGGPRAKTFWQYWPDGHAGERETRRQVLECLNIALKPSRSFVYVPKQTEEATKVSTCALK